MGTIHTSISKDRRLQTSGLEVPCQQVPHCYWRLCVQGFCYTHLANGCLHNSIKASFCIIQVGRDALLTDPALKLTGVLSEREHVPKAERRLAILLWDLAGMFPFGRNHIYIRQHRLVHKGTKPCNEKIFCLPQSVYTLKRCS